MFFGCLKEAAGLFAEKTPCSQKTSQHSASSFSRITGSISRIRSRCYSSPLPLYSSGRAWLLRKWIQCRYVCARHCSGCALFSVAAALFPDRSITAFTFYRGDSHSTHLLQKAFGCRAKFQEIHLPGSFYGTGYPSATFHDGHIAFAFQPP